MVDLLELGRKGKRSLDGNISYRKAGLLVFIILGRFTNHKQEIFRGVYSLEKSIQGQNKIQHIEENNEDEDEEIFDKDPNARLVFYLVQCDEPM